MKRTIFTILITMLFLCITLGACNKKEEVSQTNQTETTSDIQSPVAGKKVAYVLNYASSDIFQLCADACVKTANALGMSCDVYFSNGNDADWQDAISRYASSGYDGVFVSHGGQDYSYTFFTDLLTKYPDFKIVAFDTQFKDEAGQTQKIEGITQFFQDDAGFSRALLDYICNEIAPEKYAAGEPINVLKVWVGPNFVSPFDRREVGYQEYEQSGKIKTIETIGPTDHNNAEQSMADVMTATLAKYSEDEIDAVWVCYDAYARGCYTAIMESGKHIPLVSVDISNTDIQYMKAENSVWKACACTDFAANGEEGIRLLALELNNEYDNIKDPVSGEKTDWIEMPVAVISHDILGDNISLENLKEVAPKEYGNPKNLVTSEWIQELIGY